MKRSGVAALAVVVLGAMTLGAVASSASAPHERRRAPRHDVPVHAHLRTART
jgi:hypothetical protein